MFIRAILRKRSEICELLDGLCCVATAGVSAKRVSAGYRGLDKRGLREWRQEGAARRRYGIRRTG